MSKVKIQGNASGSGTLLIAAPDTDETRTLNLPDAAGTLLTSDGDGSSLTGVGATVKIIGATYDTTTASGTQDVTGFGFNPSAIWGISFYNIADDWAMGFTDFTSHRMLASFASTTGVVAGQVQFPYILHSSGNYQLGVASSITDGFRITWTKTGTPTGTLHMYFMGIK